MNSKRIYFKSDVLWPSPSSMLKLPNYHTIRTLSYPRRCMSPCNPSTDMCSVVSPSGTSKGVVYCSQVGFDLMS